MRAVHKILHSLDGGLTSMHAARKGALFAAVAALVQDSKVPLTALGRAMTPAGGKQKHGIKRSDRLLGNEALHVEVPDVYRAVSALIVNPSQRPIILVDWSEAGDKLCVLSAALAFDGRAIPLWTEAHPLKKLANPVVEGNFLQRLREQLPVGCLPPIIVTDAGFQVPFFKKVRAMGWDFVGRERGKVYLRAAGDESWISCHALFARARSKPKDFGQWEVTRSHAYPCRLVMVDKRSRGARKPVKAPKPRKIASKRAAKSAREPWVLVTSLSTETARQVANIYKRRMQIEETFRDKKSHRFGWSFEDARSRSTERVNVLVLLTAMASWVAALVGLAAEAENRQFDYQANTTRKRRVLSVVTLGRLILQRGEFSGGVRDLIARMRAAIPTVASLA